MKLNTMIQLKLWNQCLVGMNKERMIKIKKLLKNLISNFKKKLSISDWLMIVSFLIIFFTTLTINGYLGMYILSIELIIISYVVERKSKRKE
ncbi:DUF1056 family protein [Clostridium sp.]|uniref:DUF1056 family protein n=1 Tax=Clostridium sp. TaxID=1506 RepID=UPI003F66235A